MIYLDIQKAFDSVFYKRLIKNRDQARGRLERNSRPRGRNFVQNGTQGEVGVSLKKKKKIFFFFKETHFHSVTTQMQAVVTLSDNLLPLPGLPLTFKSRKSRLLTLEIWKSH